ncbi:MULTISPECIES: alpha/beta hydrolase [unclassified Beijerinckia]|uniref:alpha/beta hydrolase n=1 Tax=unclassified Beijerinckia TaxID=2638183 RepID=UPI00089C9CC4|nr:MULTISPECIES: alpha/beta hydrolase [unclassified Beijerinckia]MDH7799730.1 arylformamidase [Beijerinckia sp. GAS462]SED35185.1 arylformamidase [Beijerinckia sp. 28-YEA-48]
MTAIADARTKGPLVWGDMDQQALDAAYDQACWAPNQQILADRRQSLSAEARGLIPPPQRVAYGSAEIEKIDIYKADVANAPVAIFVHGGAWRRGRAADFAALAETFTRAGAHLAVLDFDNIDEHHGDLLAMAEQVRRAVAWVGKNAASFGGDPDHIYLTGHSSGAHLGGCMLTTDWNRFGLPQTFIKGALLCSGMYELAPVRLSKRSEYVKFTDATENELSAMRHLDRLSCPVILVYGTNESPEFIRQTKEFAAAVKATGKPVELIVAPHYNHFEIAETLGNPYGVLGRAALRLMGLGPSA